MGKRKTLKELEAELWDFKGGNAGNPDFDLADTIASLKPVSSAEAQDMADGIVEILEIHFACPLNRSEDCYETDPSIYYPMLIEFIAKERPRDVERDRKVRKKQGIATYRGWADNRSEFLFYLIHLDRRGRLRELRQTSERIAWETMRDICGELNLKCPTKTRVIQAYRAFRQTVRVSNQGYLMRFYDIQRSGKIKKLRPCLRRGDSKKPLGWTP